MGAVDYVRVADGRSVCRIQQADQPVAEVPVLELSTMGGLLATSAWAPQVGAHADCTLALVGVPDRQVFATVASATERGVTVRWLYTDAADEGKVREVIAAYVQAKAATTDKHQTRRVIRPFAGAGGADAAAETEAPATSRTSRKVVRPTGAAPAIAEAAAAQGSAPADTATTPVPRPTTPAEPASGAAPVVADVEAPAQPQAPVISKDGRMDIGASIRSRSKTVMASELAARHEKVRVLNMSTIKTLIQEAVNEAASHLTKSLGESERKRLLEEAEAGFNERLKEFQLQKSSAEERARMLGDQLRSAQDLLEQERKRSIQAEQFTVSDAGLVEIDQRMAKTLQRMVASGGVTPELETQLRELVASVLDSEREKIRQKELEAQNSKIELLEKKVKRLANTLEETERQRDDYQSMLGEMEKSGGGGLRNIMKAGIKGDDPSKSKKLELMKTILEENRALREKLGIKLNQVAEVVNQAAVDAGVMTASEAAAPAPASPAAEPDTAPAASAPDGVNPDDMPWEAQPMTFAGGENEHGVKKMAIVDPLAFTPPPLERTTDDAPAASGNPDDEPWEVQPMTFAGGANEHGVKKMAIADPLAFTPPPLDRGRA
jgi:hypothetical protein